MNTTDLSTQQALQRYHRLFDHMQYTAIAQHLAADLRLDRDSPQVTDALNVLTDTALSLCQHPHYERAWLKLATFCGQNAIPIPTIDAIYTYLLLFQPVKDTRADDFEATAKALLKAYEVIDSLRAAIACANLSCSAGLIAPKSALGTLRAMTGGRPSTCATSAARASLFIPSQTLAAWAGDKVVIWFAGSALVLARAAGSAPRPG